MGRRRIHPRPCVGQTYGRLKVIGEAEPYEMPGQPGKTFPRWWCKCACGNAEPRMVRETHLTSGKIISCGCQGLENRIAGAKATKGKEKASGTLTNEQKRDMVTRYQAGESTVELGLAFGVGRSSVRTMLERRGVERRDLSTSHRRLALNEAAFAEVTDASAYWVGFLMADGNVFENGIGLALAERDRGHVEAFRAFLGAEHGIRSFLATDPNGGGVGFPSVVLTVWCARMAADLARFGVVPRKSHVAHVVGLENNRHFWRGVVDGDGNLGLITSRYALLQLIGSRALMHQFVTYVQSVCPRTGVTVKPYRTIFRVSLGGRVAEEVIKDLYEGASLSLPRKAATASKVLKVTEKQSKLPDAE